MVDSASVGRLRWVCPPGALDEINLPNFGLALREMRRRAGLSQRELAECMGSTQSAIARMERGETEPKLCTLEKLAEALNQDLLVHVRAVEQV
jgi:transcriptional regulator with XRE-family HTH domain